MSDWYALEAPAKVNLRLDVLGRRRDGFHELATEMLAIDLVDTIHARPNADGDLHLTVEGPAATADIPSDGRNLVWRAAVATIDRIAELGSVDVDAGLDLHLFKRIPSRAGLGGGSSDAAAAVRATAAAFGVDLPPSERLAILTELGSDTGFFEAAAHTGHAWCFGRGEVVRPIETVPHELWFTLLVPEVGVSTASVYGALSQASSESIELPDPQSDLLHGDLDLVRSRLFNGLEAAACAVEPELARWRALLDANGAPHYCLSGSGSAWFGVHETPDEAQQGVETLRELAVRKGLALRAARVVRGRSRGLDEARRSDGPQREAGE